MKAARQSAVNLPAVDLKNTLDLWLTELYLQNQQTKEAAELLSEIVPHLVGGEATRLEVWAKQLVDRLGI